MHLQKLQNAVYIRRRKTSDLLTDETAHKEDIRFVDVFDLVLKCKMLQVRTTFLPLRFCKFTDLFKTAYRMSLQDGLIISW